MSKHRSQRSRSQTSKEPRKDSNKPAYGTVYEQASRLVENQEFSKARSELDSLMTHSIPGTLRALIENDLAILDVIERREGDARSRLTRALELDCECVEARQNLSMLERILGVADPVSQKSNSSNGIRVAIVSLLFNWPSTGGGTIHSLETGKFLSKAGYEVKHFYAQYQEWKIGQVTDPLPVASEVLVFRDTDWIAETIQQRFKEAVGAFSPDYVIITDSWNFKPLLAEALREYRYFVRLAAQECLCPLNNVRMLFDNKGNITSCPQHQLATADTCRQCVRDHAHWSGALHQAERELSGFGTSEYEQKLRDMFQQAEGVLVVNPLISAMVSPYCRAVYVVPSGFDPDRFPWPWPEETERTDDRRTRLFFAGLTEECMKGFHVLRAACQKLWRKRQDFELVVTAVAEADSDPFIRFIGWQSQQALPQQMRQADMLVFPTVAEEALGRSAVEAMGVGRPVIASRIGGLPFVVVDEVTGLLCEPGNADDLAQKIERLIDDPQLRDRMGQAGRKRFEKNYTWDVIIDRHYRQLLKPIADRNPSNWVIRESESHHRQDPDPLLKEMSDFWGISVADLHPMFATYRKHHESQDYSRVLTGSELPSVEEMFLIGMVLSLTRPAHFVQIGAREGQLTRMLVDVCRFLGLDSRLACFHDTDDLRFVSADEVEFHRANLTGLFKPYVLDKYGWGCLFVDLDSPLLLREILTEIKSHYGTWTLVINNCDRDLRASEQERAIGNPHLTAVSGACGWEILTELFGTDDPLNNESNRAANDTHRLKIFETQHAIGILVPDHLCARQRQETELAPVT